MSRRAAWALGALVLGALVWGVLAARLEGFVNRIEPEPLPTVGSTARRLHETSFVADLHADSLLFERDLLVRSRLGHVDLPRLIDGGVALQVFAVPTVVPLGANIDRTRADAVDLLTLAGLFQLSGRGLASPLERALRAAHQLTELARRSDGRLRIVRDRGDLERLRSDREQGSPVVGAVLAIEGAHALESEPANLQRLFDAGYRVIGLSHFFDNDYAGSAHGERKGGLHPLGRRTLLEMERLGIVADVAHMSPAALDEMLDLVSRPAVFSHGGVRGTCDNARNLSDAQIRRIADGGGLIGVGYWDLAVCGRGPREVARALVHVVDRVGDEHAALGSDYDGATTVAFDTSDLPALTQALLDAGLAPASIRRVLGGNVLRVLAETLPERAR